MDKGLHYSKGQIVTYMHENDIFPEFVRIDKILFHNDKFSFICNVMKTIKFDECTNCFITNIICEDDYISFYPKELSKPLLSRKIGNSYYIPRVGF